VGWKKEFPWLADAPSQALQQVNKDLDQAFQNFFRRCKTGDVLGYPKFKRKGVSDSFRFPQGIHLRTDLNARWGLAQLPKLGEVRFRKTMAVEGKIQNATLTKCNGKWYIAFCCKDVPIATVVSGNGAVGIDRGVAVFAALSDGTLLLGPEPGRNHRKRLAKVQRGLSRKKKFSQNWRKQKNKLQRLHTHIANIRRDFLQKASTTIVKNHAVVVIESLQTKNMTRSAAGTVQEPGKNVRAKAGLNRAMLDQGWNAFESMLAYKLAWRAGTLVKVKAQYTSQTCSSCGFCAKENRLTQDKFRCQQCGYKANADLNAAQNILAAGHVASACGGAPIGVPAKQEAQIAKAAHACISLESSAFRPGRMSI
jgi:putative transposase